MQVTVKLASTVGIMALALGQTSLGHTGGNEAVSYSIESGCKPKVDILLGIGWDGRVLGRYMIGIILLEARVSTAHE
jgi:hypothetical protein